ncbi:c-type cytochrome [Flavimaricola marinus]|uniref:Cytochrome c-552 n=1 Tax=Flavimaricola marinus TaxID=1819565 RepID=A0A238LCR9_9RHOB|nr:cytochrome c family protein [Flavimaricola marinus]SMY06736.1 Cytochrome c-552 [Flavimaricola marinus]
MFDTMTLTKIAGGLFGTFLVFLLGGWVAETIYHAGGHGDHEQAYVIDVPDSGGGEVVEEVQVPFEELYALADAADGEGAFRACRACHALEDGNNGTGPHLYGVVGRPVDAVAGFDYSGALEEVNDVWTPEQLFAFLENPAQYAPGTKMSYNGMRSETDRVNLIAYLDSIDD